MFEELREMELLEIDGGCCACYFGIGDGMGGKLKCIFEVVNMIHP